MNVSAHVLWLNVRYQLFIKKKLTVLPVRGNLNHSFMHLIMFAHLIHCDNLNSHKWKYNKNQFYPEFWESSIKMVNINRTFFKTPNGILKMVEFVRIVLHLKCFDQTKSISGDDPGCFDDRQICQELWVRSSWWLQSWCFIRNIWDRRKPYVHMPCRG